MAEKELETDLRNDVLASLASHPTLISCLANQRIAVIGGTGFVGTWIATACAAINDHLAGELCVDLLGRSALKWLKTYTDLAGRTDVSVSAVDVRSNFELHPDTTMVLFAAGIADPRVHASDPISVHETMLYGISHALRAASRLENLERFVNLSSGLVFGEPTQDGAIHEKAINPLDFTRAYNVYPESRRAAENLTQTYASQLKIPISTARAFTFLGPYQSLDASWAANNFIRDALLHSEIRIHGNGAVRRSYLYGSDVAVWLLKILVDGKDGGIYNVGGATPVTHTEMAEIVASHVVGTPGLVYRSQLSIAARNHDFFPDLSNVECTLKLCQTFDVGHAVERTLLWHASNLGLIRRIRRK